MSSPSACVSFTSSTITDFLNEALDGSLNITGTVSACPEICKLVWGSGNPDLSGIGVRIHTPAIGPCIPVHNVH
jgi:hypothetical protein